MKWLKHHPRKAITYEPGKTITQFQGSIEIQLWKAITWLKHSSWKAIT